MRRATELRFGVLLHQDAPFPTLQERWARVEALGFDQLFVCDHVGDYRDLDGDWFDGWTVDHLSGGRLELGIGTGIAPFDHAAMGNDPWPARERVDRFVEYVCASGPSTRGRPRKGTPTRSPEPSGIS